jgi:hypothetical protein
LDFGWSRETPGRASVCLTGRAMRGKGRIPVGVLSAPKGRYIPAQGQRPDIRTKEAISAPRGMFVVHALIFNTISCVLSTPSPFCYALGS